VAQAELQTDVSRALFERLIDHAALFPPASMELPAAAAEDRRARASAYAWMVDRFICPASKLADLAAVMPFERAPDLSVVLDGVGRAAPDAWAEALAADVELMAEARREGAPVAAVEVRLPEPRPQSAALVGAARALRPLGVDVYYELVPGERWRDSLPAAIGAVATLGGRVKLRCGGATADAFPPVELVALVIVACLEARVAFKATAGLHHPIRHVEAATGFHMHGFLNLLAATTFAHARGSRASAVQWVLAEEDPGAFEIVAGRISVAGLEASAAEAAAARGELFHGYGSCSWQEPVDDLRALGALE